MNWLGKLSRPSESGAKRSLQLESLERRRVMAAALSADLGGDVAKESHAESCEVSVSPGTDDQGNDGLQWTTTCGPDNKIVSSEFHPLPATLDPSAIDKLIVEKSRTADTDDGLTDWEEFFIKVATPDTVDGKSEPVSLELNQDDRQRLIVIRDLDSPKSENAMNPGIEGSDIGSGA